MGNWTTTELSNVLEYIGTGKTPPTKNQLYFNGGVNWYTPSDIGNKMHLEESTRKLSTIAVNDGVAVMFPIGSLLLTCIGNIGRVGITKEESSSNQQITALKFRKDVDVNFAYFWFKLNSHVLQNRANQAVVPILNNASLKSINFCFPPLPIQKRIAAILEKADAAREKRRQTTELTEKFLQSAFLEMFGDPVTNPKGWDKITIKNAGTIQTGTTPSSNKEGMFGGEIPFITPGDLESNEANKRFVTKEGSENSRTVRKGATFVCCIGATIGKVGRAKTMSAFNQQINAIEWNGDFHDLFGEMLMRFMKQIIIQKGGNSTTLPILNKSNFERLEIIKPPFAHQQKFAALVEKAEAMRTRQRASEQELENLFQSLMQRAFKGELVS